VIGHRLWQTRFNADPTVVGRAVRLGATHATVVGVMPEGFAFPVRQHLWMPLRMRSLSQEPRRSTAVRAFGRLAPGVELPEAQAELTTVGDGVASQFPKQYEHLQPQVLPYAESIFQAPTDLLVRAGVHSINAFCALARDGSRRSAGPAELEAAIA
jgi:putative ABC transport system permease protein